MTDYKEVTHICQSAYAGILETQKFNNLRFTKLKVLTKNSVWNNLLDGGWIIIIEYRASLKV